MKWIKNNLFIVLLSGLVVSLALGILNNLESDTSQYLTIEVQEGESLSYYASQYGHFSPMPKEKFVKWIKEENYIHDETIIIGQKLIIPVKKEHQETILATR